MFFAIIKFYRLNLMTTDSTFGLDVRKDLLLNMVTSQVMMDQTYSIVMNALLQAHTDRVKVIQRNMSKYKYKVSLDRLGVSKYFQFSLAFRDQVILEGCKDP